MLTIFKVMNRYIKVRVKIEDELLVYKDIAIPVNYSVLQFVDYVLSAYSFDNIKEKELYLCDIDWCRESEINIDASSLFQLLAEPYQRFFFRYDPDKLWTFFISFMGIEFTDNTLPFVIKETGLSPSQYSASELDSIKTDLNTKIKIKSSIR